MSEDPVVDEVLAGLPEEEQDILRFRLALDRPGMPAARTLQETAVRFGVSQHAVRQLESRVAADIRLRRQSRG